MTPLVAMWIGAALAAALLLDWLINIKPGDDL